QYCTELQCLNKEQPFRATTMNWLNVLRSCVASEMRFTNLFSKKKRKKSSCKMTSEF
ncbi:Sjoegren syndrome nuclear autoantigen 1, partial [Biomphalaria glabrata]